MNSLTKVESRESFEKALTALDIIFERNKTSKKKITDNDLKSTDFKSIQEHSEIYTDYLNAYVDDFKKKSNNQRIMKSVFFGITMFLLSVMIISGFVSVCIICKKNTISTTDVATVITAVAGAVSAFLVLPKVIAENLFPSKEQDKTAEIFGRMFDHDINLRAMYHISDKKRINNEEKSEDVS